MYQAYIHASKRGYFLKFGIFHSLLHAHPIPFSLSQGSCISDTCFPLAVTAEVASRRHVFHGQELDICPYFSCLGLSGRRQPSRFGNLQALLSFVVALLAVFLYFVLRALDFPGWEILVAFH